MSWRVQTDKQIMEISNSLTSTQCMLKELISWKDNVEEQLVGISNSLNNLQATRSNSFSPAPENWEQILQSANLDDFVEPWDANANLIDVLPEAVKPETYSLPPNPYKISFQDHIWVEEQTLVNAEIQRTEVRISCFHLFMWKEDVERASLRMRPPQGWKLPSCF